VEHYVWLHILLESVSLTQVPHLPRLESVSRLALRNFFEQQQLHYHIYISLHRLSVFYALAAIPYYDNQVTRTFPKIHKGKHQTSP
jgi:ABC-type nitrate/sulfonate/bicarbonate transport system permease component